MYIDYQILSVVEDMSANPQSKFDGMNCTQSLLAGMMIPVKSYVFLLRKLTSPIYPTTKNTTLLPETKKIKRLKVSPEHIITTGASASSSITVPQYKKRSKKQA